MRIAEIHFYPVKGCGGSSARKALLTSRGFEHDRRFMLVDEEGNFVSQRSAPKMALIQAGLVRCGGGLPRLSLSHETSGDFEIDIPQIEESSFDFEHSILQINIHGRPTTGIDMGNDSANWFSRVLGFSVRLVYQTEHAPRKKSDPVNGGEFDVSYADAFPVLVMSHASLEHLNTRLSERGHKFVGMDRFRPNIVLGECDAFAEDQLGHVCIGETTEIIGSTLCTRCRVPDVNPLTGIFDPNQPVYNTLRGFRDIPSKGVCFGKNAVVVCSGQIRVGEYLVPVEK